jgi:hypothetical protein
MKRNSFTFDYNRIGGLHTIDAGFTTGCATFLQRRPASKERCLASAGRSVINSGADGEMSAFDS